jgi:hypothetical protein
MVAKNDSSAENRLWNFVMAIFGAMITMMLSFVGFILKDMNASIQKVSNQLSSQSQQIDYQAKVSERQQKEIDDVTTVVNDHLRKVRN